MCAACRQTRAFACQERADVRALVLLGGVCLRGPIDRVSGLALRLPSLP